MALLVGIRGLSYCHSAIGRHLNLLKIFFSENCCWHMPRRVFIGPGVLCHVELCGLNGTALTTHSKKNGKML